jgi:hypothetical protein
MRAPAGRPSTSGTSTSPAQRGRVGGRLEHAPGAGSAAGACAEHHPRVAVGRNQGRAAAGRRRAVQDGIGADLVLHRMIAGDDAGADQVRQDDLGELRFQARRELGRERARIAPCAAPAPRRAFAPWRGRVTGPPWPFAGISSDASTSGGDHVIRTRIRAGTAPEDVIIASGMFAKARTGQYPSRSYLGASAAPSLKPVGKHFDPGRQGAPARRRHSRDRRRRGGGRGRRCAALLELVGEQQRGEQQLLALRPSLPSARGCVPRLAVDHRGDRAQMRFLAVAAGQGSLRPRSSSSTTPSGPLAGEQRSIWAIAPSTLPRSA